METVAQGWIVSTQTRSPLYVELLSFVHFLPIIFFVIPGGSIADRVDRRKVIVTTQTLMCVLATTIAVLSYLGWLTPWIILIIGFLHGVLWAFNGPAWQALLISLVPKADLESAIALNSLQYNLARLTGPILAGLLIAAWGNTVAFTLNAFSFLGVIWAVRQAQTFDAVLKPRIEKQTFSSVWRWVWHHKGAKQIIIAMAFFATLSAPLQGLMPFFASDVLHIGPEGLGLLLGCLGGGAVMGAFLLGQLPSHYPRHHLIPIAICCFATFMIFYSQSSSPILSYALLFMAGIFFLLTMTSGTTAMHILVPENIRGRAMSILILANLGMLPIGHIAAGFLASLVGPRAATLVFSSILLVSGIILLLKRKSEIDGVEFKRPRFRARKVFSEIILARSYRAQARKTEDGNQDLNI